MRLTKFSHSCVRLEDGDRSLVIDPGTLSEATEALDGADAVLITHEHPDHIDVDAVRAAAKARPELRIWAPPSVVDMLDDLDGQVVAVAADQLFEAAGFGVETFGSQHALIHPFIPMIANVGYLIDERLFHPGDAYTVPTKPVQTLCVPIHAPWGKVSEVIDYVISVRAAQAMQIHDGLLNPTGFGLIESNVKRIGGWYGTEYRHVDTRDTLEV